MLKTNAREIVEVLAAKFVADLQAVLDGNAERPIWLKGWDQTLGLQRNGESNRPYRGMNTMMCMLAGFADSRWYTGNQAIRISGWEKVPTGKTRRDRRGREYSMTRWEWKGEGEAPDWPIVKGTPTTPIMSPPTRFKVTEENDNGDLVEKWLAGRPRFWFVYNHEQIRWPAGKEPELDAELLKVDPREAVEVAAELWATHGPKMEVGHGRAYYRPRADVIGLPEPRGFESAERYWSVAYHELAHWTGHVTRCDREGITKRSPKGSTTYAFEELVAEMASAAVCQRLGIKNPSLIHNTSAYVLHWIETLNDNPKRIITAASKAQAAVDFIFGETSPADRVLSPAAS